jgi:hypothetical protein
MRDTFWLCDLESHIFGNNTDMALVEVDCVGCVVGGHSLSWIAVQLVGRKAPISS